MDGRLERPGLNPGRSLNSPLVAGIEMSGGRIFCPVAVPTVRFGWVSAMPASLTRPARRRTDPARCAAGYRPDVD